MWLVDGAGIIPLSGIDGVPVVVARPTPNTGVALYSMTAEETIALPDPDVTVDVIEIRPPTGSGLSGTFTIGSTEFPLGNYTLLVYGASNLQVSPINSTTFSVTGSLSGATIEVVSASGTVTLLTGVTSPLIISGAQVSLTSSLALTTVPVNAPPSGVVLGGSVLTPIAGVRPRIGQYVYNPRSGTITLLRPIHAPSIAVRYRPQLSDNLLINPSLLPQWLATLNAEGEIIINREFEEHPSGQLSFRIQHRYLDEALELLRPKTELTILGLPLRIERLNVTEEKATSSALRECIVTVELGGKWNNYTSPVRLAPMQQSTTATSTSSTNTTNTSSTANQPRTRVIRQTTVQQLAAMAGAVLDSPTITVEIGDNDYESNTEVEWASILQERVRNYRRFTFWSDPSAVRAVELSAVPHHYLTEDDILSPIQSSYPVTKLPSQPLGNTPNRAIAITPGPLPSAPLSPPPLELRQEPDTGFPEWYTGQLCKLDKTESDDEDNQISEPAGFDHPTWDRIPPVMAVVQTGDASPPSVSFPSTPETRGNIDLNPYTSPPPPGRDTSLNFDQSGPTKTRVTQWLVNGVVIRELVEIFGFAFLSKPASGGGWQQVEKRDRRNFYVGGYYVGSTTTGWRLMRYRVEASGRETVDLSGDELKEYEFFRVPIADGENVVLLQYGDYYPRDTSGLYEIYFDNNGVPRVSFNPNWYEPMFVRQRRTGTFAHSVKPAESEDEPPLKAGLESITEENNIPIPNSPTLPWLMSSGGFSSADLAALQQGEMYAQSSHSFSAQDDGYRNSAEQSQAGVVKGRPPEGQRLPDAYVQGRSGNRSSANKSIIANTTNGANSEWYLYSSNYKGVSRGSISFPGAKNFTDVRNAAESVLYVNALKSGQTDSFETLFNPNLKEGDLLTYVANGVIRRRRIMKITHRLKILGTAEGRPFVEGRTELLLARDYDLPAITFLGKSKVKQASPSSADPSYAVAIVAPPYYVGRVLSGGIPTTPPGSSRWSGN